MFGEYIAIISAISSDDLLVVTPIDFTDSGRLELAIATLFCTFTASMSPSVPRLNTTLRL